MDKTDIYEKYKESGDKNLFEEVVDRMVMEGVECMNDKTRI